MLLTCAGCLAVLLLAGGGMLLASSSTVLLLSGAGCLAMLLLAGDNRLAILLPLTVCFTRVYQAAITLFDNTARGQYKTGK